MAQIAFVDDDAAADILVDRLLDLGHDAFRLTSAASAMEQIDRISAADLVVLDLLMPSPPETTPSSTTTSGMLVYRQIRKANKTLPILIHTASTDNAFVEVIKLDDNAQYVSRWAGPTLGELIERIHGLLGVTIIEKPNRPFIVHGQDENTKLAVKNYLQNTLKLPEPIILHEQPNLGRTVIEKFEDLASLSQLVFVLLTPDDTVVDTSGTPSTKRRSRQNVIFEMGYFLGRLDRSSGRVFLLYKGPLDLPSDISGVIYIDITAGLSAASDTIRRELGALDITAEA